MRVAIAVLCLMWLCSCESRRLGRCDVARIFKQEGLDGFEGFSLGNCGCFGFWIFSTDLQCLAYLIVLTKSSVNVKCIIKLVICFIPFGFELNFNRCVHGLLGK